MHNVSSAVSLVCLFRQVTTASWTPAHKNAWSLPAPGTQRGIQGQRQPRNSFFLLCWEQAFNCNSCNFPVTVTHCLLHLICLVSQLTGRWSNQNSAWDAGLVLALILTVCLNSIEKSVGSFTTYLAWAEKCTVLSSDASIHSMCSHAVYLSARQVRV